MAGNIEIKFPDALDDKQQQAVRSSLKFRNYLARLVGAFDIETVVVDRVYWFGSRPGFIIAQAIGTTLDGTSFPGKLTVIRGDSVAVLVILEAADGTEFTLLARQPRIASGDANFDEIPAGMVDEGRFVSKALDELTEEIGADLGIVEADLIPLDSYQPSAGESDQTVAIFYARKRASPALLAALQGRVAGCANEGERINVEVIPFGDLAHRGCRDGKTRMAYYGYCAAMGRVAQPPVSPARTQVPAMDTFEPGRR